MLGRGVEHLEVDEDGYLKITDMYFNTPNEAGYILDQYGNFIHSKNDSYDSWNIMSYDGTPKLVVSFEGNVRNKIGAGLEAIHSLFDAKQSNNGVSQNSANTTLVLKDKNELITNAVRSAFGTDGSIRTQLQARNYNSSGTLVKTGSIGVVVAKDGTLSYEVTEPDKFRQAIGTSLNVTGRRLDQSGNVTQTGTSYKTIGAFNYTTKTGRFMCIASVPLKTSKNTSHSAIMINGTAKGVVTTNSQSMIVTNPMTFETFNPNTTVTIGVGINAQDSGTTATIPAYNPPMITVFDLPI